MRIRYHVPFWALVLSVPVALLVVNCGPANLDTDIASLNTSAVSAKVSQDLATAADVPVTASADKIATDDSAKLDLNDEGSADDWHRFRGLRYGSSY